MNKLYYEWFSNPDYWFSKNKIIDEYLCNKYLRHIESTTQTYEYKEIYSKETLISSVILLDQIPRHYKRLGYEIDADEYSEKAAKFSDYILSIYNTSNILTYDELFFVYLPYRHLKRIEKIYEIINIFIKLYNEAYDINKAKCKRYLYATLNNIYKDINRKSLNYYLQPKSWNALNKNIFDKQSLEFSNKEYNIQANILYNTIYQEYIKLNTRSKIIVSLSGGVDSIVALYILSKITDNLVAVHINYNNRKESQDELDFVNYYCDYLGVKLVYRTIKEIKRDDCLDNGLRDMYEEITKKIRYDMYNLQKEGDDDIYVLLGHNKDDCFENIITNITNKSCYDNLCGMEALKIIDDINFWRPMLNVKKKDIIAFANINNIPYLFDSTPKWSVRGKIRDNLRPVICSLKNNSDIIDESQLDTFFSLTEHIKETNNIINNVIISNLVNKIKRENNKLVGILSINDLYTLCYKSIIKTFLGELNIKISNKTQGDLVDYINRFILKSKENYFILNKSNKMIIKNTCDNSYKKLIII
jgi:tRNA(Ile)-lysidine synthetase-like protein